MDSTETLHTDRLIGRRLRAADFDDLARMHQNPRVMATLAPAGAPNGGLLSDDETRRFLRRNLEHWDRHGYGLWLFRDRADGRFVGRGGLKHTSVDGKDEVKLAYAVLADYWGPGLATEVAGGVRAAGVGHRARGGITPVSTRSPPCPRGARAAHYSDGGAGPAGRCGGWPGRSPARGGSPGQRRRAGRSSDRLARTWRAGAR